MKYFIIIVVLAFSLTCGAQSLEGKAKKKVFELEKLIKKAEKKDIDVLKEKTTVRTAKIFLDFAKWDEKNVEENASIFELVKLYKKDAQKLAEDLADFERNDVIKMLDESLETLKMLIQGKITRKESPNVDWTKVKVEGDQITFNNRPVFLADYSWKPKTKKYTDYHGNLSVTGISTRTLSAYNGGIHKRIADELDAKPNNSIGFVFLDHKNTPKWATSQYGENFKMREDTYTAYDIDHPGAREIQQQLFMEAVPKMAGKNYTKLGYMLCNEPHFFTHKDPKKKKLPWASGPVSQYTIDKFKIWLEKKHGGIVALNNLWETNFKDFSSVSIDIPIDITLKGTPIWYDWASFNMDRVTDWFTFLKSEIEKHDPEAKVHIKIMPNLWTENKRIHGIDLEALTDMSTIVGNDSGADHKYIWGKPNGWEKHYAFKWRELCMGFDFMKSVSPNKINFNSELHYLSTVRSRDLYLDPKFSRASFWLAHSYGMTASQIWYWPRQEDGSIRKKSLKGYAGSNNQQPRVTNEVALTLIDLNTYSEEIMAMQRQRKPLRLFYSKTSAINKEEHMDDVFKTYEALHFEGVPLGFVTKDILNKQNHDNWDVIVITETPFVTPEELDAIQSYLNNGGTVIVDNKSVAKNEYGNPLPNLKNANGTLIKLNDIAEIKHKALAILKERKALPEITIAETNAVGTKGCIWRVIKNEKGNNVLSVVNVGKSEAQLAIKLNGSTNISCNDIINGIPTSATPTLKPLDVYFVEVLEKD
ncbi:alpha-amylase family protein [Flavivirga rizhaonensis]|uniref:Glycoside hydrolase family 42 N-terminal domain-containing protein n=1 Tax=Flavivirga rizhaonensis TaxID=2559571 RepID=A0A4S1DZQ1_9FLAO|nr:alpha-amylase family protein [Flavivirga rizhaonensis]TGV03505.1 hypothetical protein EM932_05595 [Flavivirga rizhaonensis]